MSQVTIYRCPECPTIGEYSSHVEATLQRDGIIPAIRDGAKGEFRIDVGDKNVFRKKGDEMPSIVEAVRAVETETDAGLLIT